MTPIAGRVPVILGNEFRREVGIEHPEHLVEKFLYRIGFEKHLL
jgi:hypothetical protein